RTDLFLRLKPSKGPAALVERAQELIQKAGYPDEPTDSAFGFLYDGDFLTYSRENKTILWDHPSLNAASFWYRRSPRALQHSFAALWAIFEVEFSDPPQFLPGEIIVRLDTEGRLRTMKVIPRSDFVASPATAPDWPAFFSSAGLEIAKWSPAEPKLDPDV